MPTIVFKQPDGTLRRVDARPGLSVMEVARAEGVPGIVAECGGAAMCATCHVYVEAEWLPSLPPISDFEDELLEGAAAPRESNSRLGCQIRMDDHLDGLVVRVPATQY